MKYKEGDRVQIKSLDWYNKNKDEDGDVSCGEFDFVDPMKKFCGKILTIDVDFEDETYLMKEDDGGFVFTNEMIEGLVEEEAKNNNDMEEKETLLGWVKESDTLRLVPHKDYEIKHDGDNFYLVKKKKAYPKTYEECCKVMGVNHTNDLDICEHCDYKTVITYYEDSLLEKIEALYRLYICRDAYWKIAGEEMGLDKPWEPDYVSKNCEVKYCIGTSSNEIIKCTVYRDNSILSFPSSEMRDAFYENFKEDIENCKDFL